MLVDDQSIDLYSYDLVISTSILNKHKDNIANILHTNSIVLEHLPESISLKKEDLAILKSKLSKHHIITFKNNTLNFKNQHNIKYGIPLEIFDHKVNNKEQKNQILIRHQNPNIYQQFKSYLSTKYICKELDIDCSIETINSELDNCSFFIELTNQYVNVLCASAKGCKCIAPDILRRDRLDGVFYFSNINEIIQLLENNIEKDVNTSDNRAYINQQYNYEDFCNRTYDLIYKLSKKEAFKL